MRDLAIAAGISVDKHLDYRDGRKGMTINVDARQQALSVYRELSLEELRALASGKGEPPALPPAAEAEEPAPAPEDAG